MKKIWDILLYLWQLPQNLAGLCVLAWNLRRITGPFEILGERVWSIEEWEGRGLSLGRYVFIGRLPYGDKFLFDTYHEAGHCHQSRVLGWLYLPIVGLCSGLHSLWWNEDRGVSYRDFWTERWADKWAKIK